VSETHRLIKVAAKCMHGGLNGSLPFDWSRRSCEP
jgi:hypothetical protein